MPRPLRCLVGLFLLTCGLIGTAASQNPGPSPAPPGTPSETVELSLQQAIELATEWLEQGRLEPAERLIQKLRAAADPPPQVLFLSAHLKQARGDLSGAVEEFRELLRKDPRAVRARLDLALALYRMREYRSALYHFELALSAKLPPRAEANALRFVRDIRQRESYWEMGLSLISDSNVNYATQASEVTIGEAQFRLAENARAKPGTGLLVTLNGRQSFGSDLANFVNVYAEHSNFPGGRFDFFYTTVTAGRTISRGRHDFTGEAGGHYANWGQRSLYEGWVVRFSDNWRVRPHTLVATSAEARELRYPAFPFLDAVQYWLNGDVTRAFGGNSTLRVGASWIRQAADQAPAGYRGYGVRVEGQTELPGSFTVGLRIETYRFRYDAPDVLFGADRHDRRDILEFTVLRRDIQWHGFSPRIVLGHNRSTSTIPLYEFNRSYVRAVLTRQF
jgi:tetratricopeptide (TPR) repeat protein